MVESWIGFLVTATPAMDPRAGLAEGDTATWVDVVTRYQHMLLGVTRRYRLSDAVAADVVQQTWLRLFQHAGQVRDPERLAGWLATTASRQCITALHLTQRERLVPGLTITDSHEFDGTERLHAEYRAAALRAAIAQLPTRQRRLIEVMLEPDQPSYAEISRRLQMPIGSIGPTRARALRRLRDLLPALDSKNGGFQPPRRRHASSPGRGPAAVSAPGCMGRPDGSDRENTQMALRPA